MEEDIKQAAAEALNVIARAASEATKVIANSASEAAKVLQVKGSNDHDLLIELKTRMEGLKVDIDSIKNGTATQIGDHEKRITNLEELKTKQTVLISIGIFLLITLTSMLIYHLFGVKV